MAIRFSIITASFCGLHLLTLFPCLPPSCLYKSQYYKTFLLDPCVLQSWPDILSQPFPTYIQKEVFTRSSPASSLCTTTHSPTPLTQPHWISACLPVTPPKLLLRKQTSEAIETDHNNYKILLNSPWLRLTPSLAVFPVAFLLQDHSPSHSPVLT